MLKTMHVEKIRYNSLHLTSKIFLSFNIPYPLKLTVYLEAHTQKTVCVSKQKMSTEKISEHVFVPNVGYCLFIISFYGPVCGHVQIDL